MINFGGKDTTMFLIKTNILSKKFIK